MRPESLLGISLELIAVLAHPGPYPADARVGRFFRARRYLGSRDRRVVGGAAYAWLRGSFRARARWRAWAASRGIAGLAELEPEDPTEGDGGAFLADVLTLARDGLFPLSFEETLAAARALGPGGLSAEAVTSAWAEGNDWPLEPTARFAAEMSLPRWLAERLLRERGDNAARSLALALLEPAPVDLRVNLRKAEREQVRKDLEEDLGVRVEPTPWSPAGLRIAARTNLTATRASREALIEAADEGSQLVAILAGAQPGMTVIDACAGAGGKTLALADALFPRGRAPSGRLIACDISGARLEELERRARAAGLEGLVQTLRIEPEGPLDRFPPADLILVDAPCTGLGTLRRNPELKLRHGPEDVAGFSRTQRAILERFAPLVLPGGRLAYSTCSILAEENEEVARAVTGAHPELCECPVEWAEGHLPPAALAQGAVPGAWIRLDPAVTGTDAFFFALWERRK